MEELVVAHLERVVELCLALVDGGVLCLRLGELVACGPQIRVDLDALGFERGVPVGERRLFALELVLLLCELVELVLVVLDGVCLDPRLSLEGVEFLTFCDCLEVGLRLEVVVFAEVGLAEGEAGGLERALLLLCGAVCCALYGLLVALELGEVGALLFEVALHLLGHAGAVVELLLGDGDLLFVCVESGADIFDVALLALHGPFELEDLGLGVSLIAPCLEHGVLCLLVLCAQGPHVLCLGLDELVLSSMSSLMWKRRQRMWLRMCCRRSVWRRWNFSASLFCSRNCLSSELMPCAC